MRLNAITKLLSVVALSFGFGACSSDRNDPVVPKPQDGEAFHGLLVTTGVTNPDGASGKVYLQGIAELTASSYDNSNARPTGFGAGPIAFDNGHVYSLPDYMGNTKAEIIRYSIDSKGALISEGTLSIPAGAAACGLVELNNEKAYLSCQGIGKVIVFNPSTMAKISEIDLNQYNGTDTRVAPASMVIRDGLLYVGLSQFNAQWMPTKRRVEVAIIDTKTDAVQKVAMDTKHGMSVATRPIDPKSIFVDEQGDIYINCVASFGFNPEFPGGILRIKKGSTEIDPDYSIPLDKTAVSGLSGNYITYLGSVYYAGNGLLYAYGNAPQIEPSATNPYVAMTNVPVLINLKEKTMELLPGLPASNPHGIAIAMHKGKLIFGSTNKSANGLYIYNPTTKLVEGSVIALQGAPSYLYSFSPTR